MLSFALTACALIFGASAVEQKDYECFETEFITSGKYNVTNDGNGNNGTTFDMRVEHDGSVFNVGDWFDNGEVYHIKVGQVFKYNTTAEAMSEICAMVDVFDDEWCENKMNEIGKVPRFLVAGYDGENLLLAMAKMAIMVDDNGATYEFADKCFTSTLTADPEMNVQRITYAEWDTTGLTDQANLPDWWSPKDELLVSSAPSTIISFLSLFALIVTNRLL